MEPQFTFVHALTRGQVRATIWRGEVFSEDGERLSFWYEYTMSEPSGPRDDPRYWRDYFMAQTEAEKYLVKLGEDTAKEERRNLASAAV